MSYDYTIYHLAAAALLGALAVALPLLGPGLVRYWSERKEPPMLQEWSGGRRKIGERA